MVQGGRALLGGQARNEVHEARQRRQPAEPAAAAPPHAEVDPGPERVHAGRIYLDEHDRRLGDDQGDVPFEPDLQPLPLVLDRIAPRRQVHVHVIALDLDGEAAQLVGELVERAARAEVEARVVPVAREDPVADRPAVQREAHVRAAVVDRVDLVALGQQADRVAVQADDQPALRAELLERGCTLALRCLQNRHADRLHQ